MNEHPHARLVQRGHDAFARGDLDSLRELIAEHAVWHEPGRSPLGGDYKGPEGILEFLGKLRDLSDGTFTSELVDLLANSERAVAIQELRARRGDRELDMASTAEFEIHSGKITEVTVYHDDTYQFDEFWS